jgi:hypothetical protein
MTSGWNKGNQPGVSPALRRQMVTVREVASDRMALLAPRATQTPIDDSDGTRLSTDLQARQGWGE